MTEVNVMNGKGGMNAELIFRYTHESTETKINEEWSAANARTEWLINFDSAMAAPHSVIQMNELIQRMKLN